MNSRASRQVSRSASQARQLTQIPEVLWLYERALAATSCGIVISDARQPDCPIIYCNSAFLEITGYSRDEIIGRNCRFLQGTDTDPDAVEQIRQALRMERECQVVLKNYRKDGSLFWNQLTISPVRDQTGELTHYIGVQTDITQRQQAERELLRSNALLKAQQEADPNGVLVVDRTGAIASYNQRLCQMWQIPEALLQNGDREQLLNCILPLICEPLKVFSQVEYLEKNPDAITQNEIQLSDGRMIELYCAPVLSPDGDCYGRIWSFRDISLQKQTEAKLRQQAERERLVGGMNQRIRQTLNLEEVLNTAVAEVRQFLRCDRTLLYRFDPDWSGTVEVESVAPGFTPALGTTIHDTCFQQNKAIQYQQGRIRGINDIYQAGLTPCHVQLLEQFQVRANLIVPILQKDKLWGLLIAYQCTGPRQWQPSEVELLQQLSMQLGIAIQQAALFEQLADELRDRVAAEAALRESETSLKQQTVELENAFSKLKRTQLKLIQAERMSSLGQLVAGVAHEINNPVTFIHGNIAHASQYAEDLLELVQLYGKHYPQPVREIETLIEQIDLDFLVEDFPKLLSSMNMGVERIRQIVLSLKNFSRLDEADRKPANIHEGIENTLLILQHRLKSRTANIQLIKEYGDLPPVECYPGQLNQVFMNLLNNAIDALEKADGAEEGAQSPENQDKSYFIKISTAVEDRSQTKSDRTAKPSPHVIIRIADNGSGIPDIVKKRIFDPFFTTKPVGEGTGLGLSISYQIIVEKHGGQLYCFSTPGEGTEFVIEIPLNPSESAEE
jgi:PAS domain S-box-containing protein